MKAETITLYFSQGSADKVYIVNLIGRADEMYSVSFGYGRRGKPAKIGTKTKEPVPYTEAKGIYDKLVHAKQLKGYTTGADAPAFADNPNAGEDTGYRPQLLNEVSHHGASRFYLDNKDNIAMQTKWDGERRGVIITQNTITATNRKGQVKGLNEEILADLAYLQDFVSGTIILDTEDMGDYLMIFDCYGGIMNEMSFKDRESQIRTLGLLIKHKELKHVKVDQSYYPQSHEGFCRFIDQAEINNEEGVVIRLASAPYDSGRPNSGGNCLKLKFIGEATCMVIGDVEGKASMEIAVRSDTYPTTPNKYTPIGKVTIPPNYDIPEIGQLVEIKYMNIMKGEGAKLFQPRFKGIRTDKTEADLYSTLKFKKE